MPICPNCEYEYVEGVKICPDCGESLVSSDEIIPAEEWDESQWEVVYTTSDEIDAQIVKERLAADDIVATVLSQKDRNFPAPGDFSIVKLLVRKEDAQRAIDILETDEEDFDLPDDEEEKL